MTLIMSGINGEEMIYGDGSIHTPTIAPDGAVPTEFWPQITLAVGLGVAALLSECQGGGGGVKGDTFIVETNPDGYPGQYNPDGTINHDFLNSGIKHGQAQLEGLHTEKVQQGQRKDTFLERFGDAMKDPE